MEQLDSESIFQSIENPNSLQPPPDVHPSRMEPEVKDSVTARKVQKAGRERLRRDRLNEQFTELGNTLDPDRPKNDKASILTDTIQVLKDLTSQVDRLKADHAALTEESRELTQEKNDLREEKASLKADIDNLNSQYQQRLRSMYSWGGIDPSVAMHPSSYPFPMPVPIPTAPIPMHPSLQPYPFYGNQNPAVVANPCSSYVPYVATHNTIFDPQSTQHAPQTVQQQASRSHVPPNKRDKTSESENRADKREDANDITTDLELKTPGCASEQGSSSKPKKAKKDVRNETNLTNGSGSSSSACSSTHSVQAAASSNSIAASK